MPSSNLALWPAIIHLAWELKPRLVLDVGPGHGKGAVLLREYIGCPPIERVDAVEAWPGYVTERLLCLYDHVYGCDVLELADHELEVYDLVLMIDVIEHLEKDVGAELLARIPGWAIVCTPESFFENPEHEEIPPEQHRSLWSVADFGDRVEHDASQLGGVLVRLRALEVSK